MATPLPGELHVENRYGKQKEHEPWRVHPATKPLGVNSISRLVSRFGQQARVSMKELLGPAMAFKQNAKRNFNPTALQTQLEAWLASSGLGRRVEPPCGGDPDYRPVYRPAFDRTSFWFSAPQVVRQPEKPKVYAVDTPAMAKEMERLHYTRLHVEFLGADFAAMPMEAHVVAATGIEHGSASGRTSPSSPTPRETDEPPLLPLPPRMGNQGMRKTGQTPAAWVVESFEINHMIRLGDGTETVCARP